MEITKGKKGPSISMKTILIRCAAMEPRPAIQCLKVPRLHRSHVVRVATVTLGYTPGAYDGATLKPLTGARNLWPEQ